MQHPQHRQSCEESEDHRCIILLLSFALTFASLSFYTRAKNNYCLINGRLNRSDYERTCSTRKNAHLRLPRSLSSQVLQRIKFVLFPLDTDPRFVVTFALVHRSE